MILDKGHIRKIALEILRYRGCKVWINNNLPVKGRKFIGEKGVADILGYTKQGVMVGCEVKTVNDYLSPEQISWLTHLDKAGGVCLIATQNEGQQVVLMPFWEYHLKKQAKQLNKKP